jgi:hypothetical protein
MPKSDFIPNKDADFLTWHDRYKTAIVALGPTLNVTAAEIAAVGNDNADLHTRKSASDTADAAAQQATNLMRTAMRGIETNVRKLARRIKAQTNYTAAYGEQLGIEGPEDTTDLSTAKPKISARELPHGVIEVIWGKGKADGVRIYSKRDGDADWVLLAFDTVSPYVDNRPLLVAGKPESRRYRAICVLNDEEVGQPSDEIVATAKP